MYENRFNTPLLNELIAFFLKNLEDFEFFNFSSVPKKFSAQHRTMKNRFEELGKVSLFNHTLRVFVIACQKNKNLSDKIAEEVALLALLHDFGKCEKIKELTFSQADEPHNQVSAKYLSLIMGNKGYSKSYIDLFYKTLFNHHASENTGEVNDFYVNSLNECDFLARRQEEAEMNSRKINQRCDVTFKSHIALGTIGGLTLGFLTPFKNISEFYTIYMPLIALGSVLPDIDEPRSFIGRKLPIISHIASLAFTHRGFTHFLICPLPISIVVGIFLENTRFYIYGICFGMLMHQIADIRGYVNKKWDSLLFFSV